VKAAAVVAAGTLVGGAGYESVHHDAWRLITGNPGHTQRHRPRVPGRTGPVPGVRVVRPAPAKGAAARASAHAHGVARSAHARSDAAKPVGIGRAGAHAAQTRGSNTRAAHASGAAEPKARAHAKPASSSHAYS